MLGLFNTKLFSPRRYWLGLKSQEGISAQGSTVSTRKIQHSDGHQQCLFSLTAAVTGWECLWRARSQDKCPHGGQGHEIMSMWTAKSKVSMWRARSRDNVHVEGKISHYKSPCEGQGHKTVHGQQGHETVHEDGKVMRQFHVESKVMWQCPWGQQGHKTVSMWKAWSQDRVHEEYTVIRQCSCGQHSHKTDSMWRARSWQCPCASKVTRQYVEGSHETACGQQVYSWVQQHRQINYDWPKWKVPHSWFCGCNLPYSQF